MCQFGSKAQAQHFKGLAPSDLGITFISLSPHPHPSTSGHSLYFFLLCHELPPLSNLLPLPEFVWLSCLQQIESEELLRGIWVSDSRRRSWGGRGKGARQYPTGSSCTSTSPSLPPCPPSKKTQHTHTLTRLFSSKGVGLFTQALL